MRVLMLPTLNYIEIESYIVLRALESIELFDCRLFMEAMFGYRSILVTTQNVMMISAQP